MACAALMDQPFQPMYWPLIDSAPAPGVRNLQTWIETAWKQGMCHIISGAPEILMQSRIRRRRRGAIEA
jgi:hypothetical protein